MKLETVTWNQIKNGNQSRLAEHLTGNRPLGDGWRLRSRSQLLGSSSRRRRRKAESTEHRGPRRWNPRMAVEELEGITSGGWSALGKAHSGVWESWERLSC